LRPGFHDNAFIVFWVGRVKAAPQRTPAGNCAADTLVIAYQASLLHGIAFGWKFSSASTMIAHSYGPEAFPKLSGTNLLLTCAFASPAGDLGGRIFDLYGN
jgi:hypothetical protein